MTLVAMLAAILGLFMMTVLWRDRSVDPHRDIGLDSRALSDPILAYHLDWEILRDEQFRFYLFVKRVNAVQRYAYLADVSHEEAEAAIEYILSDTAVLQKLMPVKKRPPLPSVDEQYLRDLIRQGAFEQAQQFYQERADVDLFTAQKAVGILEREMWIEQITDPDVSRLLDHNEADALELARRRYNLTSKEALQVVDTIQARHATLSGGDAT